MVKLRRTILTLAGIYYALAAALFLPSYLTSMDINYPFVERSIFKSRELSDRVKNYKPKRLLYLVSEDFKFDYDSVNKDLKAQLNFMKERYSKNGKRILHKDDVYTYDLNIPSREKVENLESAIADFNLDKNDFMAHLSDLNLFTNDGKPYLIKRNKNCEVFLCSFKNQSEFFDALLDENIVNLDGIIIHTHGNEGEIIPDKPAGLSEFSEIMKIFDPRNHITVRDALSLSLKKIRAIRSKFTKDAVGYLMSCETLMDDDERTTLAEAFAYLFRIPFVASRTMVAGWTVDIDPYDNAKIDLTRPETITSKNMIYDYNNLVGDWVIVHPKDIK